MTERFRTDQPGITSWHCFSAGPHYDPDRIAFGPVVGLDEHFVAPGAGFDWHGHRGVLIASWVLAGTLRHEDSRGTVRLVRPDELLVQSTGSGIRHAETNASDTDPLRFVQITILADQESDAWLTPVPTTLGDVTIDVRSAFPGRVPSMALVLSGEFAGAGEHLAAGAFRRFDRDDAGHYQDAGGGRALVVEVVGSK